MIEEGKKREKDIKRDYPYLGEFDSGLVVLFINKEKGLVIRGDEIDKIGDYSEHWAEKDVTLFKGDIILRNV